MARVAPLWGAHFARFNVPTDRHCGAQVTPDQSQQPFVGDGSPQQVHQHVMVDGVKEPGEVEVHRDRSAVLHARLYLPDRLVCIAARSKAETRFRESRIEDRREHLGDGWLDHPDLDALSLVCGFCSSTRTFALGLAYQTSPRGPAPPESSPDDSGHAVG